MAAPSKKTHQPSAIRGDLRTRGVVVRNAARVLPLRKRRGGGSHRKHGSEPKGAKIFHGKRFHFRSPLLCVCVKGVAHAQTQPEAPFGQQRFCQASEG